MFKTREVVVTPKNLYDYIYLFLVCGRIVLPISIFRFPLLAIISSFILDLVDAEAAARGVISHAKYEKIDKILDLWWYLFLLTYSFLYLKEYFLFLFLLFCFRLIGEIFFLVNKNRRFLFYFPNFFENVFILFFLGKNYTQFKFLIESRTFYYSLFVACAAKLFQEYWLHVINIQIREDILKIKTGWSKKGNTYA